jgi:phytoene synthase
LVRRHDPDRFLTALFAPPNRRETLMLLYAFNHEIARASEVTREPTLALIRLQWWREVVEGAPRRHEVAEPLADALEAGVLARTDLLAMIEGREQEAEAGISSIADFHHYVSATAGSLGAAAARALGAADEHLPRFAALGTAYGMAGQLRSVAALARQGRCLLPEAALSQHGLLREDVMAKPDDARLRPLLAELAQWGRCQLAAADGPVPRALIAAGLPAVLARRDLRRVGQPTAPRGVADRLAVLFAALRAHL